MLTNKLIDLKIKSRSCWASETVISVKGQRYYLSFTSLNDGSTRVYYYPCSLFTTGKELIANFSNFDSFKRLVRYHIICD